MAGSLVEPPHGAVLVADGFHGTGSTRRAWPYAPATSASAVATNKVALRVMFHGCCLICAPNKKKINKGGARGRVRKVSGSGEPRRSTKREKKHAQKKRTPRAPSSSSSARAFVRACVHRVPSRACAITPTKKKTAASAHARGHGRERVAFSLSLSVALSQLSPSFVAPRRSPPSFARCPARTHLATRKKKSSDLVGLCRTLSDPVVSTMAAKLALTAMARAKPPAMPSPYTRRPLRLYICYKGPAAAGIEPPRSHGPVLATATKP